MAAVVVTAQNERIDDAEATTNWNSIGGGAGLGLESDYFYQNANCIARKGVSTGPRGFYFAHTVGITSSSVANPSVITCSANHDLISQQTVLIAGHSGSTPSIDGAHVVTVTGATTFTIAVNVTVGGTGGTAVRQTDLSGAGTYNTAMLKIICTTPGLIETFANDGFQVGIGSDVSNEYLYDLHGSDTYPARSSWLIVPLDPNVAAYRDETNGTPVLTTINYYALEYDQTATSQGTNQGMDAIDVGAGLTLVGGDGGDTDGVWADFVAHDEGTIANRYGYVTSFEDVIFIFGQMIIGTATATVFNDSSKTIIFPDGLFAQGFSGITVDLQSASTDIDLVKSSFLGKGSSTTEETRPQFLVTGTSGDLLADVCTFDAFDSITLTSAANLQNCIISNSKSLALGSGALNGCTIFGATTADGVAFITTADLSTIQNCAFTFSDGHAIKLTATGTFSFTGNAFTGYGSGGTNDAAIYNNSGGAVTLNIAGGGGTPTIRNGAGASTTVVNAVTVTFEAVDKDDAAIASVRVTAYLVSDDSEVINTTTNGSGIASTSFSGSVPVDIYYRYRKSSTGATKYENLSGFGTIASGDGLTIKRSMTADTVADPTI